MLISKHIFTFVYCKLNFYAFFVVCLKTKM
nr:MAG TPA: hypothetical protein [Caudoviricetes sp.]